MDGLEEGEIFESVTSDNELDKQEPKAGHGSTATEPDSAVAAATTYRSSKVSGESSSESNSDVDEESRIWKQKKQKFLRKSKERQMDTRSSPTLPEYSNDQRPNSSQLGTKKQNNIWGSVLEEQSLTQSMSKSVGVTQKNYIDFDCRNVESYDYRTRFKDSRPEKNDTESEPNPSDLFEGDAGGTSGRSIIDYEDTVDAFKKQRYRGKKRKAEPNMKAENEPKKGGIFDRLGTKRATTMSVGEIDVSEDMNKEELVKRIADFLHEPKVELIERVVDTMGPGVAIRIVKMTRDVEHAGGLYTFDGSRKRTPGGVFIQLTKQQPEFTLEVKKLVFKEDCERLAEERKERRKKRKSRKKKKKQSQGQDKKSSSRSNSKSGSGNSRSNSKSGSTSPMHDLNKATDGKSDSDSEESDDERHGRNTTQEFNLEAELAAAKKKILEVKDKGNDCVEMEDDVDKENIQEVDDLNELDENNVVDVLVDDASFD